MLSPLEKVNALSDVNWNSMILVDKFKNIEYPIINKIRYLKKQNVCNSIICYDTETYLGSCKLIANSDKEYLLNPNFDDCLNFLFNKAYKKGIYRFWYNLDFDISAILKLWNEFDAIDLLSKGIRIQYNDYKMSWLKGKYFILAKDKYTVRYTDLFNFYKIALNKASKTYLKNLEKDRINSKLLNIDLNYWNDNLNDIIKYCIKDCIITKKLAKILINGINECNVSLPKMLISAGSLAKADFRTNCYTPNLKMIPKSIIQIAYDCYFGGKFEIMKKGWFDYAYLYDINSQYPSFAKDLYDLNYGIWKKVDYISKNPKIAYYKVDMNIPANIPISTIPIKLKSGMILTICGKIKNRWLTWFDLDLMRNFITKIHVGYKFIPTVKYNPNKIHYIKPFYDRIMFHFNKKAGYKGIKEKKILYEIHKLCINAWYGSNIERHTQENSDGSYSYSVGILFNPIYASQITAFGRWSVIKPIPFNLWKFLLAIHTDSLLSEIDLSKYLKLDKQIGNWNLEQSGKCIILNTGMYQIGKKCATRGIPKKPYIKNWLRFCLKYGNLSKKEFEINHMRKIRESIVRDKNLDNLNIMTKETRSIECNSDYKRHWFDNFYDFNDMLTRNINSKLWYLVYDFDKDFDNNIDLLERLHNNPFLE